MNEHDFEYQRHVVGYFTCEDWPVVPETYAYEPYRGTGHHELQSRLERGPARCRYRGPRGLIYFDVVSCQDGQLELENFARASAEHEALEDVVLEVSDLWTGSYRARLHPCRLDNGQNSQLRGRLRFAIAGRELPRLGQFGDDAVCLNTWMAELPAVSVLLAGEDDGEHVVDEGERGTRAVVFRRRGSRVLISVGRPQFVDSAGNDAWPNVPCSTGARAQAIAKLRASLRGQLEAAGAVAWFRDRFANEAL
ncbi:MAG: hypothetical protein AAGH15_03205 [Myxococcota bacterium]